jgi:hypothetical protein
MSETSPGNRHDTDTHTHALDLLRDALGATVIAISQRPGPAARHRPLRQVRRDHDPLRPGRLTPMPRLLAAGPRCAVNHSQASLRWCCIRCHCAFGEHVNRPEQEHQTRRGIAARARLDPVCRSVAADEGEFDDN